MNDLQALENELNRLYAYKNDIETGRRPYNQWEYNDLLGTIQNYMQMRENMMAQSRYQNSYYPNNTGYIDPRYQQNNSLVNRNGFGTPAQPVGYYPPNMSSGSDNGDNRFANKAKSTPQTQVFQSQPVQPVQQPKVQEVLKPFEGNEFPLVVAPGLESRKETSNGWYRYEVYGNIKTILDPKVEDLANTISHLDDAKKFCLEKSLDGVTGKIVKNIYGKTDDSTDVSKINSKLQSSGIVDAILAIRELGKGVTTYIDTTFTKIINKCIVGGLKKKQELETLVGDLDEMSNLIKSDSVRVQNYFDTIKESIRLDINNNITCELKDDIFTLKDKIPFIYIESELVLGNIEEVMRLNDISCVKSESNPGLYSVFQKYFERNSKSTYVMLYTINKTQELYRFIVCKDINNNFIIAK